MKFKRLFTFFVGTCLAVLITEAMVFASTNVTLSQAQINGKNIDLYLSTELDESTLSVKVANQSAEVFDSGTISNKEVTIRSTVLVDVSTSVPYAARDKVLEFIGYKIENIAKNEEMKIVTLSDQIKVLQDFTSDRYDLEKSVENIAYTGQESAIYDAIYNTIPKTESGNEDPCFYHTIVITDGIDYSAQGITKEELYMRLQAETYPIDVVCVSSEKTDILELFEDRIDPYYAMTKRLWNDGDLSACKDYIIENMGELAKFQSDEMAAEQLSGIHYIFGDCFYYDSPNNDYQNAKLNYGLALNYAPQNPIYHRDYAITLARLSDVEGAKDELKKAEQLELDSVSLDLLNGEIDYAGKKYDSAINYFAEVISASDDEYLRYRAYHSSDEIFKLQGDYNKSIELLSDCLTKKPLNRTAEMRERLADSYYKSGDNKKAIKIFEELIETSTSYNLQQNLVILYQNENEFERAAALLSEMREQYPNDYRVPMRQAFLDVDIQAHTDNEKRDYAKTVEYYTQAKEVYAKNVKPGESDPEMQQLEAIIAELKDNKWISEV